jgi:Family of unknown function (DUF6152)
MTFALRFDVSRLGVWRRAAACGLALAAVAASPGLAHHSAAMFDFAHPVTLSGTVKDFNWSNPHISVDLYVDGKDGSAGKLWTIEASSTGVMSRAGWTKRTLNPGDKVSILCSPLRDGGSGGSITSVTLASGKVITWLNARPPPTPGL